MSLRQKVLACGAVAVAIGAVCVAPVGATAAGPQPAWRIEAAAYPTNFVPESVDSYHAGPAYRVLATNVGGERTNGPFTLEINLPVGIDVAAGKSVVVQYGPEGQTGAIFMACSVVARTITCSGEGPGVGAGEQVRADVPLELSAAAADPAVAEAVISGGGATEPRKTTLETTVSGTPAPFGFLPGSAGRSLVVTNSDGAPTTQAGAHPQQLAVSFGFPTDPNRPGQGSLLAAGGGVRDVSVVLPPGFVVNPAATPRRCRVAELEAGEAGCPDATQIGVVRVGLGLTGLGSSLTPLYNMVPPPGVPAELGFEVAGLEGIDVFIQGHLRSDGSYELAADARNITAKVAIGDVQTVLWGDPSAASHDQQRGPCGLDLEPLSNCPVPRSNTAFLTMPSACSGPLLADASIDSWIDPTTQFGARFPTSDLDGNAVGVSGCSALGFVPTISLTSDTSAGDSPTGLDVDLQIPQDERYESGPGAPALAGSTLRDAKVTLPAGVSVNPSAANGREACTEGQIGFDPRTGHYSGDPAGCPDAAKIGSVEVVTPLLKDESGGAQVPHPLPGAIYLAQPYENPFGSLLAIYLAIHDPVTGVVVKLGGHVEADPATGQLTTTFTDNPQLPFEDFKLRFFSGARAALKTPATCGGHVSESLLSPWSGIAPVLLSDPFPVTSGAGGAPCAGSPGQLPNAPSFQAGSISSSAGSYSPFVLHLSRADGSQTFSALDVSLPEGLTGRLAGTPYCPESVIAAAAGKSGLEEQSTPSCPAASEVGRVTVGAGAGSQPFYAGGRAYLAGPYKGAPLSLVIVTPAVAGPYDLGDVVVRAALILDPFTAQITVQSDPLPTILMGIPLDVRSIDVRIDKPNFTLNPTSCEPMALGGQVHTTADQVANVMNRFQASGCGTLGFRPKLKLSLKGATKRSGHPALKAVVTYPQKGAYSNIARAQVGLPHSEFLDQGNLNKVCTHPELLADACPAKSIYGHAKAWTPLLDKPLEGPVYLGVGFGYKLPALVADLNGQVRILLKGRVDTTKRKGIRNTFEAVPDAPVSRFVLSMKGGKKYGLLENSENICHKTQRASARFVAHSGRALHLRPKIANSCTKRKHRKHHGRHQ